MPDALDILRWIAPIVSACFAVYWGIFLYRVRRARRVVPAVSAGLSVPLPQPRPQVSVIVPAHNEEQAISSCAERLLMQDYPDLEIIFVLDRCTDGTLGALRRAVGEDARVQIIENDACPDDWAGKCHAASIGAKRADGEWLLFTDADTEFDPRLVRAALGLALERDLDLLSLLSTLKTSERFERIVQPVAMLQLMRFYPLDQANRRDARRNFANGQFMLFRRGTYERIGGHAAVKNDLLEDIAMARLVRRSGGRGGVFFDDRMLRCAMYDSYDAFRRGWKRIFIEAGKRRPQRLRRHARRLLAAATGEPAAHLATIGLAIAAGWSGSYWFSAAAGAAVIAAVALRLSGLILFYRTAGAESRDVLAYERGAVRVVGILLEAARDLEERRPIRWGGREYILEPGSAH